MGIVGFFVRIQLADGQGERGFLNFQGQADEQGPVFIAKFIFRLGGALANDEALGLEVG